MPPAHDEQVQPVRSCKLALPTIGLSARGHRTTLEHRPELFHRGGIDGRALKTYDWQSSSTAGLRSLAPGTDRAVFETCADLASMTARPAAGWSQAVDDQG